MQIIIANVGPAGPPGPAGAGPVIEINNTQSPYTAGTLSAIYTVYNTVASPFVFNFPSTPGTNQTVSIVDASLVAGAHQITINGNGNEISTPGGRVSSTSITINGGASTFSWDGTQWTQTAIENISGSGTVTTTGSPSGGEMTKFSGGTSITNAVAGTDYQAPLALTTTGSSGAATLISNTLNIPQYSGGGGSGGGLVSSFFLT